MSGLWTPDGERPAPTSSPTGNGPRGASDEISPDQEEAVRRQLAAAEAQLLSAPVGDVIANHCYGLFQLAGALHLGQQPPDLDAARLAIDALGAVVDGLGARLGDTATTLGEGLAQIRLAYVQIAGALGPDGGGPEANLSDANGTGAPAN